MLYRLIAKTQHIPCSCPGMLSIPYISRKYGNYHNRLLVLHVVMTDLPANLDFQSQNFTKCASIIQTFKCELMKKR